MNRLCKLPPCSIYDIAAMETWLSDLASQGLFLQRSGRHYFRFQKQEPANTRYRLEPVKNNRNRPECGLLEFYADAGWEYVSTADNVFYIWRTIRPDASELHSDPIVQSADYDGLCTRLFKNALLVTFAAIVFSAFLLSGFVLSPRPVMLFLASPLTVLVFIIEIACAAQVVVQFAKIFKLKRSLSNGLSAVHDQNYRDRMRLRRTGHYSYCILSLLVLSAAVYTLTSAENRTITEADAPLPYLPLDVIEQNPDFAWHKDTCIRNSADAFSHAEYSWTPLVPVHYDIYQQGEPRNIYHDDNNEILAVEPSARTEYFRLALSSLALPLYHELIKNYTDNSLNPVVKELPHPGFDCVTIAKTDGRTQLFAVCGRQVLYICYYGTADLAERLDLLADAL